MTEAQKPGNDQYIDYPECKGKTVVFEEINIQWKKGNWSFNHPERGPILIDTYSIWNPSHWNEIAERLINGQRCAMYIMGNFGVAEVRESPEWQKQKKNEDEMFDKIKKRPRALNFVAFVDPEDIIDFIDVDRLHRGFKQFRWPGERLKSYVGPQHNVFPVRDNETVDEGLIRKEDNTIACFWIPGHFGFEGIANTMRKKLKHGIFGGGSLNIHGQEPCYTRQELFWELTNQPDWQAGIDFILFDELAEEAGIGRSQTMVSFSGEAPQLLRIGSLFPDTISVKTGHQVDFSEIDVKTGKVKLASSLTPYDTPSNLASDAKVGLVLERINRYKKWYLKYIKN